NWSPGQVAFTIDGAVTHTITPANMQSGWSWPFDSYQERLLLDLQVGAAGGTINSGSLPQSMLTDWVRVYGLGPSGTPTPTPTPSVTPLPTPTPTPIHTPTLSPSPPTPATT